MFGGLLHGTFGIPLAVDYLAGQLLGKAWWGVLDVTYLLVGQMGLSRVGVSLWASSQREQYYYMGARLG